MNTARIVGGLMAIVVVAGLGACGGDSTSAGASSLSGGGPGQAGGPAGGGQSGSGGLPDPCTLITRAQAEQALGKPAAGPGVSEGGSRQRVCKYEEEQGGPGSVTLTLTTTPDTLKTVITGSAAGGHPDYEQVSGVGDEALFAPGLEILFVRKGGVGILVQVATLAIVQGGRGGAKDIDVQLATGVLAHL